MKYEQIVRNIW